MGRKKMAPKQMGAQERLNFEWNMLDDSATTRQPPSTTPAPGTLTIVADDDPLFEEESKGVDENQQWEESQTNKRSTVQSSSSKVCSRSTAVCATAIVDEASAEVAITVPEDTRQFFRLEEVKRELNELVGEADFVIPAYGKNHPRTEKLKREWHWEIGRVMIKLVDRVVSHVSMRCLCHFQECWLYFPVSDRSKDFIYFEVYDEVTESQSKKKMAEEKRRNRLGSVWSGKSQSALESHLGLFWKISTEIDNPWNLLERLSRRGQKKFHLEFGDIDSTKNEVELTLYGRKDSLEVLRHPSEKFLVKDSNLILQELMKTFFKLGPPDYTANTTRTYHDFHELFEDVKCLQQSQRIILDINVQHSSLKPRLRPYQEDAVCWMLKRERYCAQDTKSDADADDLHPMYTTVATRCGKTLYYNKYGGSLLAERPKPVISPPGGILADEMGLGKTVEVLCCMLLHPRDNVPLPERLPTLLELEANEDSSLEEFPSSSATAGSSLTATLIKRTNSDSCSLSSVPSDVISFEVSEDHSYQKQASSQAAADQMAANAQMAADMKNISSVPPSGSHSAAELQQEFKIPQSTASYSADANLLTVAAEYKEEFKPPISRTNLVSKQPNTPSQAGDAHTMETMEDCSERGREDTATEATRNFQTDSVHNAGDSSQTAIVALLSKIVPECPVGMEEDSGDENDLALSMSEKSTGAAGTHPKSVNTASTSLEDVQTAEVAAIFRQASPEREMSVSPEEISASPEKKTVSLERQTTASPEGQTTASPEEKTGDKENLSRTCQGSKPRCRKRGSSFRRKRTKAGAARPFPFKTSHTQGESGEKESSADSQDAQASSVESASQRKRPRTERKNKFVQYVTEDEFQDIMAPDPIIIPQKQLFECVCGKSSEESGWLKIRSHRRKRKTHTVTCVECGTSQHAECLNYDLEDPFRGQYKCPHCHYQGTPVPSGATLIVSPSSISHQWTDEIKKHVRESSIKVFVYKGVNNQGYVQPHFLASQDIVITTYETLRKELNYVDLPHTNSDSGRRLRNPKKFMALPTPLTAVEWWRVCLDEAQMVECVTTKTAEMALRLSCVNRWCVTGTPLNHSVDDLFGLLAFLGFDPYCVDMWWKTLLLKPYLYFVKTPLVEALAQVMWRTAMKDVQDQLGLPGQTEEIYHLSFSPVEDIFYQRLYKSCSDEINWAAGHFLAGVKGSTTISHLGQALVARFFRPLIKLRQACCHPQAVKGSFIAVQESMLTMDQLLDNLIKKTVTECMESHRGMIAAMNGQAGIYLIENPPRVAEAVAMYRAVLMSVEEHEKKNQFKTDALPHLHTLHNLKEVLDAKPDGVDPTLRDGLLGKQCEELKERYMQRAGAAVTTAREQLAPYQQTVQELTHQLASVGDDWFVAVLSHAALSGNSSELIRKVHEDISVLAVRKSFRNVAGLQYIIETELQDMHVSRDKLMKEMKKIDKVNLKDRSILEKAITCCLRPADNIILKDCAFCKLSDLFEELESKLFDFTIEERTMGGVEQSYRKGTWQDGAIEVMLKAVLSFARNHHLERDINQAGSVHIRLFDAWKKEFKLLRALWAKLKEEMSAVDELEMAVTRMRLRLPEEAAPGEWDLNVREKTELPSLLKKYAIEQRVNAAELRAKCGTLEYLKNLGKGKQGEFKDGINPDQCPICKDLLGRNWSVLQCGHCFCMDCIGILVNSSRIHHSVFKCACCREKMTPKDISYVSTARSEADNFSSSVKGSHSTKVAAVTQCIINIKREEPNAKVLVFATWIDVLKLVGKALEENEITFTNLYDHGQKFEKNVTQFKENPLITALLMPYHTGSKGLNLFEANHVLLIEPILNPAQEAQAIGRVYRMGQTKPTKIHRFLIKQTIEERIHQLMESVLRPACKRNDSANDLLTVDHLISLFEDCREKKGDEDDDLQDNDVTMEWEEGGAENGTAQNDNSSQDDSGILSLNNSHDVTSQIPSGAYASSSVPSASASVPSTSAGVPFISTNVPSTCASVPSTSTGVPYTNSVNGTHSGNIAGPSSVSSRNGSVPTNTPSTGSSLDEMAGSSNMP